MTSGAVQQERPALIEALTDTGIWPHPVSEVRIIATHISWVLLTGEFAYKIKRPLDLGFLDFTTLEQRREACLEELRLNRRTAPSLYLDVIAFTGTPAEPDIVTLDEAGEDAFEYAVRMREFPQECQLDRQLALGELEAPDMDALAELVAQFHLTTPRAGADDPWASRKRIGQAARDNFSTLAPLVDDAADTDTLENVRMWTNRQLEALTSRIEQRRTDGYVRECHGDMHLSNLARLDDSFVAFDCIEFDPAFRWMDVMSEVAFLVMDLAARHRVDLGWRFLNRYLELSGDYEGIALLRFYIVYATMVRAKIAGVHAEQQQPGSAEFAEQARRFRMHLGLAERAIRPRHPVLILTCGLSGTGKTWVTSGLSTALPAIRIRSDLERKRLHSLAASQRSDSRPGAGIYDSTATLQTYTALADRARAMLNGGFDIIVDAASLKKTQRRLFSEMARDCRAEFVILNCTAPENVLRERIVQREWDGADASEANLAVLDYQLSIVEALSAAEQDSAITIDTGDTVDPLRVTGLIWNRLGRETTAH